VTAVRVGTCSWADESLVKAWYPANVRSAEGRLHHYAGLFDTVEVNSSYYALPSADAAAAWARRTPEDFVFHVKAFGVMTRHPVKAEQLPPDLRDAAPLDHRGRVERPSREFRAEIFGRFIAAIQPLREAGKLGGVLMQFPPYVVFGARAFEYLEWASDQLAGHEMLVEFRHRSWFDGAATHQTLEFLERLGATNVIVDAPRTDARNLIPTVAVATSRTAYLRLHGRNAATWNHRGGSAAERFDHLYTNDELAEWVDPLGRFAESADHVYAMFNNNGRTVDASGATVAEAPVNAEMLRELLRRDGVAVSDPAPPSLPGL
jgi:uncharacterized protein YecE (DUF72 family)